MNGPFGIATGAWFDGGGHVDWAHALDRARREGWRVVELTAGHEEELESLVGVLAVDDLAGFERVTIHAPVLPVDPPATVARLPRGYDTILHPNAYDDATALGEQAVFENMDATKRFGRNVADLATRFERHPHAGFCLDVAHVWTNDPTLRLGHDLLDAFGHRLRQLHVSGIEPDGTHRGTTPADLELYAPLLDRCRHVPWLLEAPLV